MCRADFAGEIFQQNFGGKTGVFFMRRLERRSSARRHKAAARPCRRALESRRSTAIAARDRSNAALRVVKPTLFKRNRSN